jgi:phospholipid/cholesterol/gamma-HCH transport system substrate-binding protein
MAQRKQLTWTDLKVGIFVLVGLIVTGVGVFYVTGAGASLSPKYQLFTYLPDVQTLTVGAPVRLNGVDVGNVDGILLTPNPSDPEHSVKLTLRIDRKYQNYIRTGSVASLETEGLLGNQYVTISRSLTGLPVPPSGEIPGKAESSIAEVASRGIVLEQNIGTLTEQVQTMIADVQKGRGTLGKLLTDPALYNNLNATVQHTEKIVEATQQGRGTLGKLVTSDDLYKKADSAINHADNMLGAIQDQKGTLGKFVYDPAFYQSTKRLVDNGNSLLDGIQAGKGSLGKLATDDSLFKNLNAASTNIRDVTGKLNQGRGTFGQFVNNPDLYNNLTGLTGDMQMLIGDFRKNPKKFLHIKLGIF